MQGIFISYRRQDSQSAAGRLADHVKEHIPDVPVFRDVETIEPGVDFIEAINRALESCGVLLAVIGPKWVSLTDAAGRRRVDNPNDYTRLEITTALKRKDVRVIPVLVEGAQMPEPDDLPEDLQGLCRRNAIELTDKRWNFDVSQLIDGLRKALDIKPSPPDPVPGAAQPTWYSRFSKKQWASITVGVVATIVMLGLLGGEQQQDTVQPGPVRTEPVVYPKVSDAPVIPDPPINRTSPRDMLTGTWQDEEGGRYYFVQGSVLLFDFKGNSKAGPVNGSGVMLVTSLTLTYTLNGTTKYSAKLEMSADGNSLKGIYSSEDTGESGMMVLQRIP